MESERAVAGWSAISLKVNESNDDFELEEC